MDTAYYKAKNVVDLMGTNITGVFSEQILVGSRPVTKNAIIKVFTKEHQDNLKPCIKPYINDVLKIKKWPELWTDFKIKLHSIGSFTNFSDSQIEKFFEDCSPRDTYLSDNNNVRIKIIQLGSIIDKLDKTSIELLS